jgi:energy-coupling factor transport system ATP-binding protein
LISLDNVSFSYAGRPALDHISLRIGKGEHVALIGPNSSGKSTLARIMNGLLLPDAGDCLVDGVLTRDDPMHARRAVGMVFQDPESQIISRLVRDDVAFGPGNLGLPGEEISARVRGALEAVGLKGFEGREVSCLSGGQKQLLAIAGILAMRPEFVILDEPTALLDARGSALVRKAMAGLKSDGIGTLIITHDMEEACQADRIVALIRGRIVADMSPAAFFNDSALIARIGVRPPYSLELMKHAVPAEVVRECR